jgi:hypothetical protein
MTTDRSVVFVLRPLVNFTVGAAPNFPVTVTLLELAPDGVGVQPFALVELQAASETAMAATAKRERVFFTALVWGTLL